MNISIHYPESNELKINNLTTIHKTIKNNLNHSIINSIPPISTSNTGEKQVQQLPTTSPRASSLIKSVRAVINQPFKNFLNPIFKLESNEKSASFDSKLLRSTQFDVGKTIKGQGITPLISGSKFRNVHILEQPLQPFTRWTNMKEIISRRASYPMEELNKLSEF